MIAARVKRLAAAAVLVAVLAAGLAQAEVVQKDRLRIKVEGGLSPSRLPRDGAAPISVSVGGRISTTDGTEAPQLKVLQIELNRHGRLSTRGLPLCRPDQIQPASSARARRACGASLVGRGSFSVDVTVGGGQETYPTSGQLLVFNGRHRGRPALLAQMYSPHPFATSFVIPFTIGKAGGGTYGTRLTASLPQALGDWGHVTGLELRLSRRYRYRGKPRSVISASCPAPKGFSGVPFSLARTTFRFAEGRTLTATLTRSCRVR